MLFALLSFNMTQSPAFASGNAYGQYDVGDGEVFAPMPAGNNWPEGVCGDFDRDLVYVTGPAAGPTSGTGPSWVNVFDMNTGDLVEHIDVQGEDLNQEHALVECALDEYGNLYVNSAPNGVLKFTRNGCGGPNYTWTQSQYSSTGFPILVSLPPVPGLPPAVPNGLAFGPDGELYITDSVQGIIFMVPPGGGDLIPLIVDPVRLGFFSGGRMGANGIKFDPDREYLYIAYTGGDPDGPEPMPGTTGKIYRYPYNDISDATLELVYDYNDVHAMPDGLAFDKDGDLFVVLVQGAISELKNVSTPSTAYESQRLSGPMGASVGYTEPSTISMDPHGKFAFVVNHALDTIPVLSPTPVPDPSPFVVFKVYVGVRGDSLP